MKCAMSGCKRRGLYPFNRKDWCGHHHPPSCMNRSGKTAEEYMQYLRVNRPDLIAQWEVKG